MLTSLLSTRGEFQPETFLPRSVRRMDKIAKLLKKLSAKEQERLGEVLGALLSGETSSLDIKKLKGIDHVFRVRVGSLRVIFHKHADDIRILEVSRRNEKTYEEY